MLSITYLYLIFGSLLSSDVVNQSAQTNHSLLGWWQVKKQECEGYVQFSSITDHSDLYLKKLDVDHHLSCYIYRTTQKGVFSQSQHEGSFCYPGVIVTGVRKAGTSAAFELLRAHPQFVVSGTAYKENCPFLQHLTILHYFHSLPTPEQLQGGRILLDGCQDVKGNMFLRKVLHEPRTLYIMLMRDFASWAWSAYNFWCEDKEPHCDVHTHWAVVGRHNRSPVQFAQLATAAHEPWQRGRDQPQQVQTQLKSNDKKHLSISDISVGMSLFDPDRLSQDLASTASLCDWAQAFHTRYLTTLWAGVAPKNTVIFAAEEFWQNPAQLWTHVEQRLGLLPLQGQPAALFKAFLQQFSASAVDARVTGGSKLGANSFLRSSDVTKASALQDAGAHRGAPGTYAISKNEPMLLSTREVLSDCWQQQMDCAITSMATKWSYAACNDTRQALRNEKLEQDSKMRHLKRHISELYTQTSGLLLPEHCKDFGFPEVEIVQQWALGRSNSSRSSQLAARTAMQRRADLLVLLAPTSEPLQARESLLALLLLLGVPLDSGNVIALRSGTKNSSSIVDDAVGGNVPMCGADAGTAAQPVLYVASATDVEVNFDADRTSKKMTRETLVLRADVQALCRENNGQIAFTASPKLRFKGGLLLVADPLLALRSTFMRTIQDAAAEARAGDHKDLWPAWDEFVVAHTAAMSALRDAAPSAFLWKEVAGLAELVKVHDIGTKTSHYPRVLVLTYSSLQLSPAIGSEVLPGLENALRPSDSALMAALHFMENAASEDSFSDGELRDKSTHDMNQRVACTRSILTLALASQRFDREVSHVAVTAPLAFQSLAQRLSATYSAPYAACVALTRLRALGVALPVEPSAQHWSILPVRCSAAQSQTTGSLVGTETLWARRARCRARYSDRSHREQTDAQGRSVRTVLLAIPDDPQTITTRQILEAASGLLTGSTALTPWFRGTFLAEGICGIRQLLVHAAPHSVTALAPATTTQAAKISNTMHFSLPKDARQRCARGALHGFTHALLQVPDPYLLLWREYRANLSQSEVRVGHSINVGWESYARSRASQITLQFLIEAAHAPAQFSTVAATNLLLFSPQALRLGPGSGRAVQHVMNFATQGTNSAGQERSPHHTLVSQLDRATCASDFAYVSAEMDESDIQAYADVKQALAAAPALHCALKALIPAEVLTVFSFVALDCDG